MTKQEEMETRIEGLLQKRPAALAEYEAAWDLYCAQIDPDTDDPNLAQEADRTAKALHGIDHAVASYRTQIERMNHPANIERANQTKTRLENLMESKTPKTTARDQGVPEVYLSDNGNFKPGADATYKSDLINAVLVSRGKTKPKPNALHVFESDDALGRLEMRGWIPFLDKSSASITMKEEKAFNKAQKTKDAAAAKKTKTAKDKVSVPEKEASEDVTPDPKPEPRRRGGRRKIGS